MGTAETIKTFTADDLRGFYTSAFRPENAILLAVGDITADKVAAAVREELRLVEGRRRRRRRKSCRRPTSRRRAQIYLVDKPGAAQSQIRIGRIGVPRVDAPTSSRFR